MIKMMLWPDSESHDIEEHSNYVVQWKGDLFDNISRSDCNSCGSTYVRKTEWVYWLAICLRLFQCNLIRYIALMLLSFIVGLGVGLSADASWTKRLQASRDEMVNRFLLWIGRFSLGKKSATLAQSQCSRDNITTVRCVKQSDGVRESGVRGCLLPKHIAVIMDGNRRFGMRESGNALHGHREGCRKLVELCQWCCEERVQEVTVYAFSTENWKRERAEVDSIMNMFLQYSDELLKEASTLNMVIKIVATDVDRVPSEVFSKLKQLEDITTKRFEASSSLKLNVCLSYGGRSEIVQACRRVTKQCIRGEMDMKNICEASIAQFLLSSEPDILIRTSGERRLSNFLLWQLAYTELFFIDKLWPEVEKRDLLAVLEEYSSKRRRRFGR